MHNLLLKTRSTSSDVKSGAQRLFIQTKNVTEKGEFEGYGSIFGEKDSVGDIVMPGAFIASLERHKAEGTLPAMLWQHDPEKPIGVYIEMREDEKGLYVKGRIALETQLGREAHALLMIGALNGLSIGYRTIDEEYDEGRGAWLLKELDLWEVSLVTFQCCGGAKVEGVKSLDKISTLSSVKDIEKHLREEGGYSKNAAVAMIARMKVLLNDEREARNAKADVIAKAKRLLDDMETYTGKKS